MGRSAKAAKQQKQTKSKTGSARGSGSVVDEATDSMSSLSMASNENIAATANGGGPASNNSLLQDDSPTTEDILNSHIARTCTGVLASIPSSRGMADGQSWLSLDLCIYRCTALSLRLCIITRSLNYHLLYLCTITLSRSLHYHPPPNSVELRAM